ncbi:helix-turn-helix domain-containing protein [Paenibacillus sp. MMS20-IR301]|uniref:helix-turn-helix domain-containing protein n=1 Tax=Paenibacillus sp. MMS20-IR301 TaxID=2895946 RepID=UPI0028EA5A76|nr:helix-turn-helix domain-containing protein [Paenibacillus sp. MMS20-IR301]WNS44066.1 helix-turn-helix domain-containing protein [Paenibacillus sp. MMS20-IR301]
MVTMLVVDDEIYALKGITQGIDWSSLPISKILEAGSVQSAKQLMQQQPVQLVISDIEMQQASGLELLRWIHGNYPHTLVIFLTGHARFEYAHEALQLGCFDYALKPIDHDLLKGIVGRALTELEAQQQQRSFHELLEQHQQQWSMQLPVLVERFWQDLLAGRLPLQPKRLDRQFGLYHIPLRADGHVLPILLSIEHWNTDMSARDETIMEYALRKEATEIIIGKLSGVVIQDSHELNLILLYGKEDEALDREALLKRCRQFVSASSGLHCRISCYVGSETPLVELTEVIASLVQAERTNTTSPESVIDAGAVADTGIPGEAGLLPSLGEWAELLEQGQQEELIRQLELTVKRLQRETASRELLEQLYYGLLHMFYQAAYRKGLSIYELLSVQELNDTQAVRSPQHLLQWARRLACKTAEAFESRQRNSSPVITKAYQYIQEHLHQDLTRDDIAALVGRNPAYLSRLFRKETGMSLSEYITLQRIERAKKLLVETGDKISSIAEGLGYVHFSYFAKLFRKLTGFTPQDYRRIHRSS